MFLNKLNKKIIYYLCAGTPSQEDMNLTSKHNNINSTDLDIIIFHPSSLYTNFSIKIHIFKISIKDSVLSSNTTSSSK